MPSTSKYSVDNFGSKASSLMDQYSSMSKQYLKIISCWCLTLLIMNCVYIAFSLFKFEDVDINEQKKSSCIAIGVLLHYFLLCSFCFSLCITIIQFFIIYKSFKVFRFLFIKASLFSFGKSDNVFSSSVTKLL